jgi:hypothetical protein
LTSGRSIGPVCSGSTRLMTTSSGSNTHIIGGGGIGGREPGDGMGGGLRTKNGSSSPGLERRGPGRAGKEKASGNGPEGMVMVSGGRAPGECVTSRPTASMRSAKEMDRGSVPGGVRAERAEPLSDSAAMAVGWLARRTRERGDWGVDGPGGPEKAVGVTLVKEEAVGVEGVGWTGCDGPASAAMVGGGCTVGSFGSTSIGVCCCSVGEGSRDAVGTTSTSFADSVGAMRERTGTGGTAGSAGSIRGRFRSASSSFNLRFIPAVAGVGGTGLRRVPMRRDGMRVGAGAAFRGGAEVDSAAKGVGRAAAGAGTSAGPGASVGAGGAAWATQLGCARDPRKPARDPGRAVLEGGRAGEEPDDAVLADLVRDRRAGREGAESMGVLEDEAWEEARDNDGGSVTGAGDADSVGSIQGTDSLEPWRLREGEDDSLISEMRRAIERVRAARGTIAGAITWWSEVCGGGVEVDVDGRRA